MMFEGLEQTSNPRKGLLPVLHFFPIERLKVIISDIEFTGMYKHTTLLEGNQFMFRSLI